MTNVLLLTSSPRGEASLSTQVATELVAGIANANVTTRELWREPLPPITPELVHAVYTPEGDRTPAQRKALEVSDKLIEELKSADVVVIGAGMINFGVPSSLKLWLDLITRAGVTFSYGEGGVQGHVTGKKLVLVLATGGVYSAGPMAKMDFQAPYLHTMLGFLGMTDVETILIEGTSMGPEVTEKAVEKAKVKAATFAQSYAR